MVKGRHPSRGHSNSEQGRQRAITSEDVTTARTAPCGDTNSIDEAERSNNAAGPGGDEPAPEAENTEKNINIDNLEHSCGDAATGTAAATRHSSRKQTRAAEQRQHTAVAELVHSTGMNRGPAHTLRNFQTLIHSYIFSGMVHLGD